MTLFQAHSQLSLLDGFPWPDEPCPEAQRPSHALKRFAPAVPPAPAPILRPLEEPQALKKPNRRQRFGIVTATEIEPRMWMLRYRDPSTRRDIKRRINGFEIREIKRMCLNISNLAMSQVGYLPGKPKTAPTISDGLASALRLSRARDWVKEEMSRRSVGFVEYLKSKYPDIKTWDALKPSVMLDYVRHCEAKGLAYDSIRHRLKLPMMAWRQAHADYPGLVMAPPRVRLTAPPRKEIECLTGKELSTLLDWLKTHNIRLYAMATLQGLCGLRVYEAAFMRRCDVDAKGKMICVAETPFHKPKTAASFRKIPVPDEVIKAIESVIGSQKVVLPGGEVFTNRRREVWKRTALSHEWTKAMRRAAVELKEPRYSAIPARKLRAAFVTLASQLGASDRLLKAYIGHVSGDVLGGHYRRITPEELKAVSDLIEGWRNGTIPLKAWNDDGNSDCKNASKA